VPAERYRVGKDLSDPAAVLVRSADMHTIEIAASVRAIARAGAGTNNIPVKQLSARGVPVFNAPGANANAVKELVLAGMLMAARHISPALQFVNGLDLQSAALETTVEDGKKNFAGYELQGQTLGIVGLGKIAVWSPMRPSDWACRCSATTPTSRSMRRGACLRRSSGRPASTRCCAAPSSSPCTCRCSRPPVAWSTTPTSA
jgi:phosphoglycerate dehydrogenase-like enzyme